MISTMTNSPLLEARSHAIAILQKAAQAVTVSGQPGSSMTIDTLHNAVRYLLRGQIEARRGVANLWANLPVFDDPQYVDGFTARDIDADRRRIFEGRGN